MNLDELQEEVEKILSLLKDRQPGLMAWNLHLDERLRKLLVMIDRAYDVPIPARECTDY